MHYLPSVHFFQASLVVAAMFVGLTLLTFVATAETSPRFRESTIETGVSLKQLVLPGFFSNSKRAELVVATIDEDQRRVVKVYALREDLIFDSTPVAESELPDDVIALDVGRVLDRDVLVFFTATSAFQYDPFNDVTTELIRFSSIYNVVVKDEVPQFDGLKDLNEDGLDDFVIPGFDGLSVFLQAPDGSFRAPVQIHAPPVMEMTYNNNPWYQARALFHTDMTLDGRKDLVFWLDDKFAIYSHDGDTFSETAIMMESNVPFEFDGVEGVSFRMGEEDQSDLTARVLFQLRDLNGDEITDLVTLTVTSKGVFNKSTTYGIHMGKKNTGGALVFSELPTSVIESKGIQFEMEEKDLDKNGEIDIVVSSVQLGIGKIIGALITGSVNIDLNFYQMEKGVYPDRPNATREITATFNLSSGDFFFPFVLIADVNGDPYADLLVQDGLDTIRIYEGEGGGRLFGRRAIDVKVGLPNDADLVQLADLNNDGKQDLIMRLEKKNTLNRVSVLISQ